MKSQSFKTVFHFRIVVKNRAANTLLLNLLYVYSTSMVNKGQTKRDGDSFLIYITEYINSLLPHTVINKPLSNTIIDLLTI